MKRLLIVPIIMFCCFVAQAQDQIKEHFKKVDQTLWIVKNLDHTIQGWKDLGFNQIQDLGKCEIIFKTAGTYTNTRMAVANLGGANIVWIQKPSTKSVFQSFHKDYGDGAMSLVHRLGTRNQLRSEIDRLASKDVNIKEEIIIKTPDADLHYFIMDTNEQGKYYLGYTYGNLDETLWSNVTSENQHNMKINQYAFAANNKEPISEFWKSLGLPEMSFSQPSITDKDYWGRSEDFDLIQGWQRHGNVAYEWCFPTKGPNVYEDHIKQHGEGIHHLAYSVQDMDKVINDYKSKGYQISMSGGWGEKGKPGSGRFAYVDMENAGGLTVELLWNYKE